MASPIPVDGNLGEISKMKVAELKKVLKTKGLSTTGTKTELVERLQSAGTRTSQDLIFEDGNADTEIIDEDEVLGGVEEGGEFDDDDLTADAVLADEPKVKPPVQKNLTTSVAEKRPLATEASQEVQPKKRVLVRPTSVSSSEKENGQQDKSSINMEIGESVANGKKIVKLSAVTVKERLELRAQKFGVPLSEAAKKEARAARFGIQPSLSTKNSGISASTKITLLGPSEDILKKRAERFGGNVSSLALKVEEGAKLKKRQERFGVSAVTGLDDKKKLRAERFKL